MTIYLTKTKDGHTHHFRATVAHNGVEIVQGIFYNAIDAHFHKFESHEAAEAHQKELVAAKQREGYEITEFVLAPENTLDIYDKAKWHFEGDFPPELPEFQGYVHTGMFFGWLIDQGLVSEDFEADFAEEVESFKQRQHTGAELYQTCCDGTLMLDDLSELGNRFAMDYFSFETGQYLADYETMLGIDVPSIYHVADTWENYEKLKPVIDKRFVDWQQQQQAQNA